MRFLPLVPLLQILLPAPAGAQRIRELQVQGLVTLATVRFVGAGLGVGIRPPGRLALAFTASAGDVQGALAGRVEALTVFRLAPYGATGIHPYGAAGLALLSRRVRSDGYVTLILGLESRPAARSGWFLEGGVGGGSRLSAGIRLRRVTAVPPRRP